MKRTLVAALAAVVAVIFCATQADALPKQYRKKTERHYKDPAQQSEESYEMREHDDDESKPVFPEKGWHKGPFLAITGGFMQVTNDTHAQTGVKFNGSINPAFGLAFGWDIADWIGPMLQMTYSTQTANVGNGTATYPVENAREHVLDFAIFARATLPYFTRAKWQPKMVKIIPYVKLGGVGHALFMNAPTDANKGGTVAGGIGVGAGVEFYIWKGLFVAIDFTEDLLFQKALYRTINGANTKVTNGGFKAQARMLGMLGWHF